MMTETTEGEWIEMTGRGLAVRVLLDDGRKVVARLPKPLARSLGPLRPGQRVTVEISAADGRNRIVGFLSNRGPRSPFVRVSGWRAEGDAMQFIMVARTYTGVDLRTAKEWWDRLRTGEEVDLYPPDARHARTLGVTLLSPGGVVRSAVLTYGDNRLAEPLKPPPPPASPPRPCPSCTRPLKHLIECGDCGWLAYPGDRARWGLEGVCPRCGFSYRWDGAVCSHCGYGIA